MLKRIFVVAFACYFILSCASSNQPSGVYNQAEANAIKGKHWLKMNLKREGVIATDSNSLGSRLAFCLCRSKDKIRTEISFKI